jgi:hypothetical protein
VLLGERSLVPGRGIPPGGQFWRRIAGSAFAVVALGSLLHFAWEWSGRNPVVAVVAAMNESTWEHLKMAFWPALAITPIQRALYGQLPGWPVATMLRVLVPPVLIVLLFYGYTAFLGRHDLLLDVGIFVLAVVVGESLGHAALSVPVMPWLRVVALASIALAALAFSTLSFRPPGLFLFTAPTHARPASSIRRSPTGNRVRLNTGREAPGRARAS